jgi:hypothetical protein
VHEAGGVVDAHGPPRRARIGTRCGGRRRGGGDLGEGQSGLARPRAAVAGALEVADARGVDQPAAQAPGDDDGLGQQP